MKNPSIKKNITSPWSRWSLSLSKGVAIGSIVLFLIACGDDASNTSKPSSNDDGREVATLVDMGRCTSEREGDTVYVAEKLTDYLCKNKSWVDLSENATNSSSDQTNIVSSAKEPTSSSAGNGASSSSEEKTPEEFIRENVSVTGVAQKGPFKFNSPLELREFMLRNDSLIYTGRKYDDEISSNKGDFVIPKVDLVYPYAVLEVRGQWRNEITGEYSKDSMSLRALTDLSKRSEVNVNLLTHLEYDRAVKLISKGYSVYAAKKQADFEIMTSFGFATSVEYSEDLKTFVPSTNENYSENATLMAISLLFIGDRNETEIQSVIGNFKSDLAEDGEWNNVQMKADMADWAESFDGGSVRANVKSWNILDIPNYESFLTVFWNNAYELGGCASTRLGVVAQNKNEKSRNYNVHYICKTAGWQKATGIEKDTYKWDDGEAGEVKIGDVTATYYVFENGKWTIATELQYDTYLFGVGKDGEVRVGNVNKDKYYTFELGEWRSTKNEIENSLGACVTGRDGEIGMSNNTYYICNSATWAIATALEYDTYGWNAGIDGDVRVGNVNADKYYVYENGTWRASASEIENNLGACVSSRNGEKQELNDEYYACKLNEWIQITEEDFLGRCSSQNEGVVAKTNKNYYICKYTQAKYAWTEATAREYDTYGKKCTSSGEGDVINGEVNTNYKYYCSTKGWVSLVEDWNWEVPKELRFNSEISYGTITDSRDNKVYKTVKIGDQTWMAENLNYADSMNTPSLLERNWCYDNVAANCDVVGRLYTWAAAIDSVALYDGGNGVDCGYGKTCTLPTNLQGICPKGWHLPTKKEWKTLLETLGSTSIKGSKLKAFMGGWYRRNARIGTDEVGFSALPAGYYNEGFYYVGLYADFWSSTEDLDFAGHSHACSMSLGYASDGVNLYEDPKSLGFSVRCLQD